MRSLIDIQDDLLENLLKESGTTVKKRLSFIYLNDNLYRLTCGIEYTLFGNKVYQNGGHHNG